MRHAREDYERFQDPLGLIPEDEPVFLIRGKDKAGPEAVRAWATIAELAGADPEIVDRAKRWAVTMEEWQDVNGSQVPDLPTLSAGTP